VRKQGPPSEIGRLAAPLLRLLDGAWQRMHWWIATMAVLYLLSGITVVRSDEVAVILRWGRLVGDTPALQEHGPGLLFAFPRPVDQVVRVQVKHVYQVPVSTLVMGSMTLGPGSNLGDMDYAVGGGATLDPLTQGYAVTGDHNIVHVDMIARYRIRDAAAWAFYGPNADDVIRVEVTAAMVRSLGEMDVDRVLSDGRKTLITTATRRAQEGLDAAGSGLELASLELTLLAPPAALASEFAAVQSAFIGAETQKKEAQAFAERIVPQAKADADSVVQAAQAAAATDLSQAKGDAEAFVLLARAYHADPEVVRERMYRDAVERAIGAANVRWVPPPEGGTYHGLRVTVPAITTTKAPAGNPAAKPLSENPAPKPPSESPAASPPATEDAP
jgi:membrane protease subunit HflK